MEIFGILGMVFGILGFSFALSTADKVKKLEAQLKSSGVLSETEKQ
ncbi:hypothetical protein [Aliidiomarina minuta]|nr:hypothetical protein [Aliidiomarina minuta]